jgi:DNA modification methylase
MSDDLQDVMNGQRAWAVHRGDCIPHMAEMPAGCVDFAVFSPPFPALYAYTSSEADIGNSENLETEAKLHLSFFYRQLARVLKPGRACVVHVMQIPRMKRTGGQGLFDFRGFNIRLAERAGLVFEYDWCVRKNPQAQALRTKSRELQFAGLEADRSRTRGTLNDYLLKFVTPGENKVKIDAKNQVSRNDWIKWAEGTWDDIAETDTLNTAEAKTEDDVKHICPLQLEVIRRLVLLYSNPGELVFSPFTGVGSEGYVALGGKSPKTGRSVAEPRRFYGCELKPEYHAAALRNLAKACRATNEQRSILDLIEEPEGEPCVSN